MPQYRYLGRGKRGKLHTNDRAIIGDHRKVREKRLVELCDFEVSGFFDDTSPCFSERSDEGLGQTLYNVPFID